MIVVRSVLLVSSHSFANEVATMIEAAGCRLMRAKTFQTAKQQLSKAKDLLVTELKLGEFNGLQLALRSLAAGIPAIVIADSCFEREVEQLGAVWMSPTSAASGELTSLITRLLQGTPSEASGYLGSGGHDPAVTLTTSFEVVDPSTWH